MSVRVLDGGVGQEVYKRLGRPAGGWPPLAAVDHFDTVVAVHAAFLSAGAEVITANTYGLGRWHMNMGGLADRFAEANLRAAMAAAEAREAINPGAIVAASIGPVRRSYEPDMVPPPAVVEQEVVEQALLLAPEVDLFLCETLSSGEEAAAAARAARATGKPVWVSFTLNETGPPVLRSGEPIAAAVGKLVGVTVDAILLNCTTPEAIDAGIGELARVAPSPFGAYANAFLPLPAELSHAGAVHHVGARKDLSPEAYAAHAARWVDAGATIVGGCCEVGPEHIAALADLARARR